MRGGEELVWGRLVLNHTIQHFPCPVQSPPVHTCPPTPLFTQVPNEEVLRLTLGDQKGDKDFEFDRVFSPSEGQDKVGAWVWTHKKRQSRRGSLQRRGRISLTARPTPFYIPLSRPSSRPSPLLCPSPFHTFPHLPLLPASGL